MKYIILKVKMPIPDDVPDFATPEGQKFLKNPEEVMKNIFPESEVSCKIVEE